MTEEQERIAWLAEERAERMRTSANSRRCYRDNPRYRLNAINRVRGKRGKPLLSDLSESEALRI